MKLIILKILFVIVLIICFAFIKHKIDQSKNNSDPSVPDNEVDRRKLEIKYLKVVLGEELIPFSLIEIPALKNIAIQKDADSEYLALSIFPGQAKKNSGIRAEVSIDFPYKEGDTVEYSWQLRIPENFPDDGPQNRWWVFAQCHDQPNRDKGETWDTYKPHSPPIIFGYGKLKDKDTLSFSTGLDGSKKGIEPRGTVTLTKNIWHSLRFVVKWSQKENGEVKFYFDDSTTPTLFGKGPNMLNDFQHYFKLGQYRNADINTENTVHIRKISVKKL